MSARGSLPRFQPPNQRRRADKGAHRADDCQDVVNPWTGKRRLARATSIAAILGICMGVAALIVAFALSNGFRDEMREKILQGTAHLISVACIDRQARQVPTSPRVI